MDLRYDTRQQAHREQSEAVAEAPWDKNCSGWRGTAQRTSVTHAFVDPDCLFAMEIEAGTSPATGAWAVFPEDHPVTRAILADGESSPAGCVGHDCPP